MEKEIKNRPANPFGDSRVDNPFQTHADLKSVHQDEFRLLRSVLAEIKNDPNYQSRGVAVIGEPGTGKTHLMMRLASERLTTNRLLFIRQPNNPEFILYHVYSRILESLVENVPGTPYSQIEHLLSKSISKIIINTIRRKTVRTAKDEKILNLLSTDPLNIYKKIGREGTEAKRKNWNYIEAKTLEWWSETYGFGGLAISIVKGLIRFCTYSDPVKRDRVRRWLSANGMERSELESIGLDEIGDTISKEEFAHEAISVFGKLSIEDEPLIVVFDQLEGLKYNQILLLAFGEAVKDLFTFLPNSLIIFNLFPDRWDEWSSVFDPAVVDRIAQYRIYLNVPDRKELQSILRFRAEHTGIDMDMLFDEDELETITSKPSIRSVLNCASDYFRYKVDGIPLPKRAMSFEDEVRSAISQIRNEIGMIKQFLNVSGPTFREMEVSEIMVSYINKQEKLIQERHERADMVSDSDDAGKLSVILEAAGRRGALKSERIKTGSRKFPEYVMVKHQNRSALFGFLNAQGNAFTGRIRNFNIIAGVKPDISFILVRDYRSPTIKSKVAVNELRKLEESPNCSFMIMSKENRLAFEVVYSTIIDIQNRDLNVDMGAALHFFSGYLGDHWLSELIAPSPFRVFPHQLDSRN